MRITIPWAARVYVRAVLGGAEQTATAKVPVWGGCPTLSVRYLLEGYDTISTWRDCSSPDPVRFDAGTASLKNQFNLPPGQKPAICDSIFNVALNHLREWPVVVFRTDTRDNATKTYRGGFYIRKDGHPLIGIRDTLFSMSGGAVGQTIFHEGGHEYFHSLQVILPNEEDSVEKLTFKCHKTSP
jgi:hypothetical protein